MDKYRIDSHKLMYHPQRVSEWFEGKNVYPIYSEISPSGACNHRCLFCGLDFMGYRAKFLDTEILKQRLFEMAKLGLKSVMYAGEGEPLLHKDIVEIIAHTKKEGIDASLTTNAVLFNENIADKTLENLVWVKVSISAGRRETYAKIHRTKPEDFDHVIKNMSYAAKVRDKNAYKTTLGMQILLLPENSKEVELLAKKAKEIGMDYLVVKPYSQHLLSNTKIYKNVKYEPYLKLAKKLENLNSEKFNVIFRIHTMEKWDSAERNYKHCLALPFWTYIDSDGNVWGCSVYLTDNRFYYGNIYRNTFEEIWNSESRKKSLKWCENELDTSKCRVNCRMDEVNRYLWGLKYPESVEHVNFI